MLHGVNAPAFLSTIDAGDDPFAVATMAVNAWRGRCIAHLTRAERIVTEALLMLAQGDPDVGLPHLVGERLAALERALTSCSDAGTALTALRAFRGHDPLRTFLTHGEARITLDRQGRWQAVHTVTVLRRGTADRTFLVLDEDEAESCRRAVQRDSQRLESALRRLPAATEPRERPLRIGSVPVSLPDSAAGR